jgi:hypothetical protein
VGLRVWDAAFETLASLGLLPTRKHAVDTTIVRRTNNRRKRGIKIKKRSAIGFNVLALAIQFEH